MLISVSRRVPGGIQGERAKEGPASGKVSFVVVVETGVKNFDPSGRVRKVGGGGEVSLYRYRSAVPKNKSFHSLFCISYKRGREIK